MFTGIVEELGRIVSIRRPGRAFVLHIAAIDVLKGTVVGDSIAVDGVCLTVSALHPDGFTADVMPETARVTTLSLRRPGNTVNLERALATGKRVGGHFISGHIDGTGRIVSRIRRENADIVRISAAPALLRKMVSKGSVAVDGASLTIMGLDRTSFSVSLIPHTRLASGLGDKPAGAPVNIECDLFAKYGVPCPDDRTASRGPLSLSFLESCGF